MDIDAAAALPDELTITLRRPVEFAGETYTELRLREPTVDETIKIERFSGNETTVQLVFLITAVPLGAIRKIGISDLNRAARYLMGFMSGAPATGAPS